MPTNNSSETNTVRDYSLIDTIQTRNSGERVKITQVIDDTEGLGAMDTLPLIPQTQNLDIGGGKFDTISEYLFTQYKVHNHVYDPHNRSQEHNDKVIKLSKLKFFDTVTSNSVLNVILTEKEREHHVKLAFKSLKPGGFAFFKVWRGNGSGIPNKNQSNKEALEYICEISKVFGTDNAYIPKDDIGNTIIATKR